MKCKALLGKAVSHRYGKKEGKIMGVILSNIVKCQQITEEQIRVSVSGVQVITAKHLAFTRNGVKGPSMSVMLVLDEDKLWS